MKTALQGERLLCKGVLNGLCRELTVSLAPELNGAESNGSQER